ncbi:MAG: hypothetical protein WA974_15500 [Thermodesulfobacteriota bacterium]
MKINIGEFLTKRSFLTPEREGLVCEEELILHGFPTRLIDSGLMALGAMIHRCPVNLMA